VDLGAAPARIAEIPPVERDHVHARFLPNAPRRSQRALYFAVDLW
jgi:hypothetical protein